MQKFTIILSISLKSNFKIDVPFNKVLYIVVNFIDLFQQVFIKR